MLHGPPAAAIHRLDHREGRDYTNPLCSVNERGVMAKRKPKNKGGEFTSQLVARMARHSTAESLNENVITPFATALEAVCRERGYVLNIYGESSNLVVSNEEDAQAIYQLIENYFEAKDVTGEN
jgi:hypothetical protein